MTVSVRRWLVLAALLVLLLPVWRLAMALPAFGHPTSPYGPAVNAIVPPLRHVANMVTAINFDVRGIDTVGEELMLVGAVVGTVVLLRGSRGEDASDRAIRRPGRPMMRRSDAVVAASRIGSAAILLFGLYIVSQGTQTPGGGFQAGVIIASGFILLYIGEGYAGWRTLLPGPATAAFEGGGAFLFVATAALPLAFGHAALENVLPLGAWKSAFAGGTMIVGNIAVAIAVAGSFAALMIEFMEETREPTGKDPAQAGSDGDGDGDADDDADASGGATA